MLFLPASIFSLPKSNPGIQLSNNEDISGVQEIPDVSDEDLETCNSWHPAVMDVMGEKENATSTTDLIIGEFCNRPDLIEKMKSSDQPAISVVAYGCDAMSGMTNDTRLAQTLQIYRETYCIKAKDALHAEVDSLMALTQDVADSAANQQQQSPSAPPVDVHSQIAEIKSMITDAETMISSSPYGAQQGFDKSYAMLKDVILQLSPAPPTGPTGQQPLNST